MRAAVRAEGASQAKSNTTTKQPCALGFKVECASRRSGILAGVAFSAEPPVKRPGVTLGVIPWACHPLESSFSSEDGRNFAQFKVPMQLELGDESFTAIFYFHVL